MLKDRSKMPPVSAETHDLGSRKIRDFDPLPPDDRRARGFTRPITLVDQLLNPSAPVESGTWSEETGYVRDETPEEREARARLIEEIKRHATGR